MPPLKSPVGQPPPVARQMKDPPFAGSALTETSGTERLAAALKPFWYAGLAKN